LEYAKFLREEEKAHREYLEKLYTTTTIVLGVLVTIGIGLVSFFQIKTKKDVREAVDAAFRETVGEEVQNKMEQFRKDLVQIEKGQQLLQSNTKAMRVLLGFIGKYEIEHLRKVAGTEPYLRHYDPDLYYQLKRLDDTGFILPTVRDGGRRLLRIQEHSRDESLPVEQRPLFNVKDYVEITESGKEYLELYDAMTKSI
jgi:hypothetical protein